MKLTAVKRVAAVLLGIVMLFVLNCSAYAETIQDSLEQRLEGIMNQFNSSDSETQESIQDQLSSFLEDAGLGDLDLGSLGDADIGQIIGDLGNNLAADEVFGLIEEAFASGSDMISDVINGGLGTSDGSNTATTNPATTGSPNIIIANTNPVGNTNAVGVPSTSVPTTYNPGTTTPQNIVGAGVTSPGTTAAPVAVDDAMSTSTIAVLVVLSVATIAVIVAIVIFFIVKRK